ncbi:hypothetical protein VTN96DRAFT_5096 [Rasamsonia emersonii]
MWALFHHSTEYFGIGQVRKDFTEPRPSTWTLVTKVNEKHRQLDESDYETYKTPSSASALFVCQNVDNPSEEALMRIYMQLPYKGSEMDRPEERAEQASETLDSIAQSEFDALQRLTEKRCESTPTLLGYKKDKQDEDGFVPGGYIFYLLMIRLPGIRLGHNIEMDALFWTLPDTTRDDIREAFKLEAHQ